MGILLFILASVLEIVLGGIFIILTVVWYLITFKWKTGYKRINSYFMNLALAKDQYGNAFLKEPMNKWLAKGSKQYYYGDADDTISYVCAMNYFNGSRTSFGKWLGNVLNKAEKYHMEMAINSKIRKDIEGLKRLVDAGLISEGILNKELDFDTYKKYVENVRNEEQHTEGQSKG